MKRIVLALAVGFLSTLGYAQSIPMLNVSPDAAVAGMAAVGVTGEASAYSFENNIAATVLGDSRMAVGAGYGMWQPSATKAGVLSASGYYKLGEKFAVALNYKDFSYQSYKSMSQEGQSGKEFKPKENTFGLGFAYLLSENLSAGLNVKMASSSLAESAKASTFGVDVALKYQKDAVQAGLTVNNVGGKVNYGSTSYALPSMMKAGASYSVSNLTAAAQVDFMFKSGMGAGLGLEYAIKEIAFVRGGYHYGSGDNAMPSFASLGLGLAFAGVRFDAAYLLASESLGGTMMFNLSYSF